MSDFSLADMAAVTGNENGWGGSSAWVLIILFALIFGWGGNGFGNRNQGEQPVTEAGLCSAMNFNDLSNAVGRMSDLMQTQFMQTSQGLASVGYENLRNFADTQSSVKDGNYALSRPFVMATKGEISEQKTEVQALFDYLSSDEGKALIKSVGLITVD